MDDGAVGGVYGAGVGLYGRSYAELFVLPFFLLIDKIFRNNTGLCILIKSFMN